MLSQSKTIFMILFLGVMASVLCQIGIFSYVHTKGIALPTVPPFEWYYYVAGITAVIFVVAVLLAVEPSQSMRRALGVLFLSTVFALSNAWFFFTSPGLFLSNLFLVCVLLAISWRMFRRVQDKIM
jgi:hypothetical protein